MDNASTRDFVASAWQPDAVIVSSLAEYIRIPNVSPSYDAAWADNGLLDQATHFLADSAKRLLDSFKGKGCRTGDITLKILGGPDAPLMNEHNDRRTPVLLMDIPASGTPTPSGVILLYGHLDKQPGLDGQWSEGLGPYTPVIRDGKLYGRGGADDGYALYSSLAAVMAVRAQNLPHARCVLLIESGEESGSRDLEYYITTLKQEFGKVTFIICLDSGAHNFEQLWITSSLRGMVNANLSIAVSREGVHSGSGSGVIPDPFRILRLLLSRLENADTGELFPSELKVEIPLSHREAAKRSAAAMGNTAVTAQFPFLPGVRPVHDDIARQILARTWEAQLVVKGMDGFPPVAGSGNVLLPKLTASLSFRLPPSSPGTEAAGFIRKTLTDNPPYNAHIDFELDDAGNGWAASEAPAWLDRAINEGSREFFGKEAMAMGEGASIPFMNLLGSVFPGVQFMIAGVLGPGANAHGPDEFLHLDMVEKLTMCVARAVYEHGQAHI